ncbi:GNAT family N-acetyltransferase [Pontibacter sp. G13]|uniref:GNAT family N-acetyltransferase n=1 Tax=Pontibacter sp. G13 TaxID=3074898 RepID=UPI00288A22F7|nr:GNAT family N-acetyltransferase [Pontibacter sp. G13]WNJ19056.1 GNAT family N-acetyltransferase [Pontibacter sp. G13]
MNHSKLSFELATTDDLPILEEIRSQAFVPIFESFRNILGETIYEAAQLQEDLAQADLLKSYLEPSSVWQLWAVRQTSLMVGFVSIRLDSDQRVGEIGLNAVHPKVGGQGIGTQMYEFAVAEMKRAGMKVATVATGGDPAHLPARKAYRKAGFEVEIPSVWMCREL